MLRVIKHHDWSPDLCKVVQIYLVQIVLLFEIPVGDPRILPPQRKDELDVDV